MARAALTLAEPGKGEGSVRATKAEMHTTGAAERVDAASKVCIRIKVRSHRAERVPDPARHAQFGCASCNR
eukprot:1483321-Alexandrium_andersonii.AAC.1